MKQCCWRTVNALLSIVIVLIPQQHWAFQPTPVSSQNIERRSYRTTRSEYGTLASSNSEHGDYYDAQNHDNGDEDEKSKSTSSSPKQQSSTAAIRRPRVGPIRQSHHLKAKTAELIRRKEARARHEQALKDPTLLTNVKFEERDDIHASTKRAIAEVLGFQSMTEVQSRTYAKALSGQSVLARSRTGHGKTLAFLLPSLERILANEQRLYHPGQNVGVLILSPTRELAMQIADQAKDLLTFHDNSMNIKDNSNSNTHDLSVLCLYGGTKIQKDIALMNQKIPTFLVCTPGRLLDHLDGTRLRGRKFSDILATTSILVLDEADALLQGFPNDMKRILYFLPRSEKRQALLFSATLPKKMTQSFEAVLPEDYAVVDCVADDKGGTAQSETNFQLKQSYMVLNSMDHYISTLVAILLHLMEEEKEEKHKVMVFLPTARLVKFFSELFTIVGIARNKTRVFQMHSRMSQSARKKVSSDFRHAKQGVLFTTDVSARGLDYPDISVVLQYGCPGTKEGYIHRVGRTGRAGKQGRSLLVFLPFEKKILNTSSHHGLRRNDEIQGIVDNLHQNKGIDDVIQALQSLVGQGHRVLLPVSETAYLSLLAYYSARAKSLGLTGEKILQIADCFSRQAGLKTPPPLSSTLSDKLQ